MRKILFWLNPSNWLYTILTILTTDPDKPVKRMGEVWGVFWVMIVFGLLYGLVSDEGLWETFKMFWIVASGIFTVVLIHEQYEGIFEKIRKERSKK